MNVLTVRPVARRVFTVDLTEIEMRVIAALIGATTPGQKQLDLRDSAHMDGLAVPSDDAVHALYCAFVDAVEGAGA